MAIRVVRLGTPRASDEGLRLGTARRPPRGVAKADFAKRDFFDVWLPELAPSQPLVSWATSEAWTPKRWRLFSKRYLSEMRRPEAVRLIAMLAAFSQQTNFSIGCYCEDPTQCHRSLLRGLLIKAGAELK